MQALIWNDILSMIDDNEENLETFLSGTKYKK